MQKPVEDRRGDDRVAEELLPIDEALAIPGVGLPKFSGVG